MRGRLGLALATPLAIALAACASPRPAPPAPAQVESERADFLRVYKAARALELWSGGRLIARIEGLQFGPHPTGAKHFEGDGRTPEGRYTIDWRNPHSAYHLSLHISYPDARDSAYARSHGREPGGLIMIHGQPNGTEGRIPGDWTDGCIAVSDAQIESLWQIVPDGTPIELRP